MQVPLPMTPHLIVPELPAFATAAGNTFVLVKIYSLCSGIWRSGILERLSHMPLLYASCFRHVFHFSKIKGMEVKKGAVRL